MLKQNLWQQSQLRAMIEKPQVKILNNELDSLSLSAYQKYSSEKPCLI